MTPAEHPDEYSDRVQEEPPTDIALLTQHPRSLSPTLSALFAC